jgi:glycosyltransferase involved in cell wall biosynthesis
VPPQSLSIFFPAYNDAPSIARLVRTADRTARELTDDYEIIVIDDGSTDQTAQVLRGLGDEIGRLRVVTHSVNQGYGSALRSGFRAANREAVFYTDGDGQYDPAELSELWRALSLGVDIAQGYKIARSDPLHRILIGRLYAVLTRAVFRLPVRDVDCDFRLIRRRVLDELTLHAESGAICVELVKKTHGAGARFVEVPVHHYPRQHGRSHAFRPAQMLAMLIELVRLWREVS